MTTRTCRERIIRRSKLDWVIVRPVILTDGPKTNAYRALVNPRRWTWGFISRADVADFLVRSTTPPFCIRRRCSRADANAAQHVWLITFLVQRDATRSFALKNRCRLRGSTRRRRLASARSEI